MRMRFRFVVSVVSAALLAALCPADRFELKFTFGGAPAGQEVVETKPDGSFESKSTLSVAGTTISSEMTGKIVAGTLTEFVLKESKGPQSFTLSASGDKMKVEAGGKAQEVPYKAPTIFFANFHPWLSSSVTKGYSIAKGGAQDVPVYVIEAGTAIKCSLTFKKTRVVPVEGKNRVVQTFSLRFPTMVEMDLSVVENGPLAAWDVPAQRIQAVLKGYETLTVDPTTLMKELSQPTYGVKVDKGVKIRLRDGVSLVADVIRPDAEGKFPAILVRTPYGRAAAGAEGDWWAKRGYVYVVQDVRGRFDSEGEFEPMMREKKDGYDTLDWLAKQPWSDGKAGMIGGSYLGFVQWAAAVTKHPALKCIVPQVSPPDMFFNIPYDHGVFMLFGAIWWANVVKDRNSVEVALSGFEGAQKLTTLPLSKVDEAVFGKSIPFYDKWLKMDTWAAFKDSNYLEDLKKVTIPALHISGWWDGDGIGTKMNWAKMRELGRKNQWLVYGPWTHFFNSSTRLGDVDYGPTAVIDLQSLYLRWFDTWLKGKKVGLESVPKVQAFLMGANEWKALSDWPAPVAKKTTYYFSSVGSATTAKPGKLSSARPRRGAMADKYVYDPSIAKVSGKEADISAATTVADLRDESGAALMYQTDPMKQALDLTGPIQAKLYFSTNVKDTDFFVTLMDIDAKGVARVIGQPGKIRAKYLKDWNKPQLLKPNAIYSLDVELWDTAHRFLPGHRMAVLVNSSGFPGYARNLNTGESYETGTKMVKATQTIYHSAKRPSGITFYALPGGK